MTVLDKVIEMQNQGMKEADIIRRLSDEKIAPNKINDAINQAKVKTAVSQDAFSQQPFQSQQPSETQEMQQSIMQQEQQQMQQLPTQQEQQYYYPETPQAYPEQAYYSEQPAVDTNTITEIAEQIVSERFQEFEEKTGDISSFKTEVNEKTKDLDERLSAIETSIEKLKQAIIGKIGEFGETAEYIHKDLDNLHNTVSKLMNPLIDNYKELKKISKGKK